MEVNPLAGKPAPRSILVDVPQLITAYFVNHSDPSIAEQRVVFGTSGHRGSSFKSSFNEDHILATVQAVCDFRKTASLSGPLFWGMDTHALPEPAHVTTIEVTTANGVEAMMGRAAKADTVHHRRPEGYRGIWLVCGQAFKD